jgi:hypothetical protein
MASNSTLVWATTPILGVDLDSKSSTPAFAVLTAVWGSKGRKNIYLKAAGTLSSTAYITAGAAGSAVSAASAGVATYTVDTTGGVVANVYFWAQALTA